MICKRECERASICGVDCHMFVVHLIGLDLCELGCFLQGVKVQQFELSSPFSPRTLYVVLEDCTNLLNTERMAFLSYLLGIGWMDPYQCSERYQKLLVEGFAESGFPRCDLCIGVDVSGIP